MAKQSMENKKKGDNPESYLNLIIAVGIAVLIGIVLLGNNAYQTHKKNEAKKALQARIDADPISVNGIYNAINKERTTTGAPSLSVLTNLTTASEQFCNDMVASNYFDYKNPSTGKEANSFITDNVGDLYFKNYVSSIATGNKAQQTATEVIKEAVKAQSININNPIFNSVGIAICNSPSNSTKLIVVAAYANKQDKPISTSSSTYRAPVNYTPPTYIPPVRTNTNCTSYAISPSVVSTSCY